MSIVETFNQRGVGYLPGFIGIEIVEIGPGHTLARLILRSDHMAPNGFMHAATVVALADTACGYGCVASLPKGANNFTTIELKTNYMGTARGGAIRCDAKLVHGGKTTQVWDAAVYDEANGKLIALFRCTQLVLYPKTEAGK